MSFFLTLIALLLAIATLIPLSRSPAWWVRALDFPRFQLAVIALLWLLVAMSGVATGVLVAPYLWLLVLACLFYQLWWIFPYTSLHKTEVAPAASGAGGSGATESGIPEFTFMTSNVLMDNRDAQPLLDLVHQYRPDVLATLESDRWWEQQLDRLADYPYRLKCPLDNKYGMHIYSRLPLLDSTIDFLVEDDVPSMGVELQLPHWRRIRLHIVHPRPPAPGENERSLERDVELLALATHLQNKNSPVIVSGDLNDVAWSRTTRLFRRVSGLLDIRVGRGMFNTFHADYPFLRWPLDHIFVSGHFKVVTVERLAHIGSDHFPVLATLVCERLNTQDPTDELEEADKELIDITSNTEVAEQASAPNMR